LTPFNPEGDAALHRSLTRIVLTVADLSIAAPPPAPSSDGFGAQLKARVHDALGDDVRRACYRRLHRKGAVVGAWYVISYAAVLLAPGWVAGVAACTSLALAMVAVGFNIQHDANHNAFFDAHGSRRLTKANRIAGWSINAIGGDATRWIEGHVHLHHAAPNVVGRDHDIELGPFGRLSPDQPRRRWHVQQHRYLWVVYAFTAFGIVVGDVIGIVTESFGGDRTGHRPTRGNYVAMATTKGLFGVAMIGVPLLLHPAWVVAAGAAFVFGVAGLLLGVVFQLAHAVEDASFRAGVDRADVRWHHWQVLASVDFCQGTGPAARAVTWYCGGLNHQTEHHLFPGLPHTAYPLIAPTVASTCAEFGVRYKAHATLRHAIRSHYRHLKAMGARPASG
jgi:linoleoyl-CoA desaturase